MKQIVNITIKWVWVILPFYLFTFLPLSVLAQSDDFDPTPPGNPGANYWYSDKGEVVVDDFKPGSLDGAIKTAIGDADPKDVLSIVVSGIMNNGDIGAIRKYTECRVLDLSRCTGINEIIEYSLRETKLETVYLPATIEKISRFAFGWCDNLKTMTVYALTPPELNSNAFYKNKEDMMVYVPAAAIQQYMEAEGWKDFTILPIQSDIRSLTVSLPQGTDVKDYTGMWLELENTKNGQRMHYVMTDRQQYVFNNIIYNTTWNVTLRNERGDVFGRIDKVMVNNENVTVTFAELLKPQSVRLKVMTPDGTDVTEQVQVSWTDHQGNYLSQKPIVNGLPEGTLLTYRIVLPQDLAMVYRTPAATTVEAKPDLSIINCQLSVVPIVTLTGTVTDASTGMPIDGATITATQTFGAYTKTQTGTTVADGTYAIGMADVPTTLTFAATGYLSETVSGIVSDLSPLISHLSSFTGAVITMNFTYTPCSEEGERSAEEESWYNDIQNIDYSVYNETQGRPISQFQVQYPQMVLMEDVADGDVLRLTAASRTNAFMPVEATAAISNQRGKVTFGITEMGKIQTTVIKTANAAITGTLYDDDGQLVEAKDYADAKLTFEGLADGSYTLLSMGKSDLFNTIGHLDGLADTRLTEGTDYVLNQVTVTRGVIRQVRIDEVPRLDESKLYYTGDGTSLTVNKSEIIAGNYVTLTARVDFKAEYAEGVSQVQLMADVPANCQFVENSVMVGNSMAAYTLNGRRLTIPVDNYKERVRFCIVPTQAGRYATNAYVQFALNDETVTQPIGSAAFSAEKLTMVVPATTDKTTVPVSGLAVGSAKVKVYDGEVLVGETTAGGNGSWMTMCALNEPYNLSAHYLKAVVTTHEGVEMTYGPVRCTYDKDGIAVKKVMMYHNNCAIAFDYQNPTNKTDAYSWNPWKNKYTFTIDLANNDPDVVTDMLLWAKLQNGKWCPLEAAYDAGKNLWVAAGEFKGSAVVNVCLDYMLNNDLKSDLSPVRSVFADTSDYDDLSDYSRRVDDFARRNQGTKEDLQLFDQLCDEVLLPADLQEVRDFEAMLAQKTDAEINAMMDEVLATEMPDIFEGMDVSADYDRYYNYSIGDFTYVYRSCDGLTMADVPEGSTPINDQDGTTAYIYQSRDRLCYVDFAKNIWFEVSHKANNTPAGTLRRGKDDNNQSGQILYDWESILMDHDLMIKAAEDLQKRAKDLTKQAKMQKKLAEACKDATRYNKYMEQFSKMSSKAAKFLKGAKRLTKLAKYTKGGPLLDLVLNAWEAWDRHKQIDEIFKGKEACKDSLLIGNIEWLAIDYADSVKREVKVYHARSFIANTIAGAAAIAGAIFCPPSLFVSIPAIVGTNLVVDHQYDKYFEQRKKWARDQYVKVMRKCLSDQFEKYVKTGRYPGGCPFPGHDKVVLKDPSGYVYEAVPSNRLEGVTATIFYKETVEDMYGDQKENVVKWDAETYGQENPLFTDEGGNYRWDVPDGLWQVTFEKQGYETTRSEWLPVPPPQLDINIAMRQNVQPAVKNAHAYQDAVVVEFDKYMMGVMLTAENIRVTDATGTEAKAGTIRLTDEEDGVATKVRFEAAEPFGKEDLLLTVSNRVMSYAGIRMQDDYQQTFSVGEGRGGEIELKEIRCDSVVYVGYGEPGLVTVTVLPAAGAEGRVFHVKTLAPMIVGVETGDIKLDENGSAQIAIFGNLPGSATLTFTVDDSDLQGSMVVEVGEQLFKTVAVPTSNIASGVYVDEGTEITLSCTTEGATIYYTLDGSCPCENTSALLVYDGTPIVINQTTTIKAMAVAKGMEDSSIAAFTYFVGDPTDIGDVRQNDKETMRDAQWYNLNGQRVSKSYKGIVIVNGNKVVTK